MKTRDAFGRFHDLAGTSASPIRSDNPGVQNKTLATDALLENTPTRAALELRGALDFNPGIQAGDTTPPTLTAASPADNATGVAVGANIVLTFSEAVTAGSGFIVLRSGVGTVIRIAVTDTSQVTISGNTVTINPTADLAANTAYNITLASGVIKDIAGNNYAGITSPTALNFTTGATGGDTTPPTLTSTSPADNAASVAVGANITMTFNEAVKAGSGAIEIHRSSDGSLVTSISVTDSSQVSFSGSTVTINPTADLTANTGYYIVLASGVILDSAGNAYAGISSNSTFNFTTAASVDTTPPTLSSTTPADNATGVAVGANITMTFNEAVKAGSGAIEIHRSSDGSLVTSISVTDSAQVSFSGSTVTINPTADLIANTGYYIVLASGVILDSAGNAYAGISSNAAFNFTTAAGGDTTAPTLTSTSPADNATGVAVGANITMTFNEAVKAGSGAIEIHRSSDGSLVTSISVTDGSQVSFSGSTVTINPTADLVASTDYYIVLASGVILDSAGNAYAGISSTSAFNFTTAAAAPDTTPPTLTAASPADNATGVAPGANIVLTFSEAVKAGTGYIVLHNSTTGATTRIAVTDASQVTISGNTVTINPTADLAANTVYYITLASGVIKDIAGNNYAGITSNTALNFSTGAAGGDTTPPTLTSTSPADNATGIAVGANITMTFNETVKAGSGAIEIHRSSDGSLVTSISVTDSSQVSFSGSTVTINPTADLTANTGYYIVLASGVILDSAGNAYAGISSNSTFNFTTAAVADTTPPTLTSTSPADDATGVAAGANITMTFNEAVKAGSGAIEIHRSSDGSLVTSISVTDSAQVSFSGSTVTINPTADLAASTGYYIVLASGVILDSAGNAYSGISSNSAFNFTTAASGPDTTPPTLSSTSPTDHAAGVAIGANITMTFNEAVKVGNGVIEIHRTVDSGFVTSIAITDTSQITFSGNTVTINPAVDLASNTGYYIVLASGVILDSAGNPYAGISSSTAFNFQTAVAADTTAPGLTLIDPLDNATGVAVGTDITLFFSEWVKAGSGVIEIHRTSDGSLVTTISITDSAQVRFSANSLTINPTADLASNTGYYILIAPGAVLDASGNAFAGISSSSAFNFTTASTSGDGVAPLLTTSLPNDNSSNVSTDLTFALTFNEAVKGGAGVIEFHLSSDNSLAFSIAITDSSQIRISGNTVTINPTANLLPSTGYYIVLAPGVILDSAGNPYAGISSPTALNFTTGMPDITPPLLASTGPADNETHVPIGANLTLNFNSTMQAGTGVIEIHRASDGALITAISVTDTSQVAISGNMVTINPAINLAYGTEYYVLIASGVLVDPSGNPFAGITSSTAFSFTTAPEVDIYPPLLMSFTPADNSTGVAVGTNFVLTFSEPLTIQPGGNIQVHRASDGVVVATAFFENSSQATVSGNTVTVNFPNDLRYGTDYYVTISFGAFYDPAQNFYAGLNDTTTFTFSTVVAPEFTPPVLVSSSPADNAGGVAVDSNIVLTFSETVVAGIGVIEIHRSSNGQSVETININDTSKVTISGNVVTINPNVTLDLNTSYYITITPGTIEDVYNNAYAGISSSSALNFFTGTDTTAPVVVTSFDDTTGWLPNSILTLQFSEPVQAGSGVIEIHRASDGALLTSVAITDTTQVSFAGVFVNIDPTINFATGTEYYVLISPGAILDTVGNAYAGVTTPTLNFTTAVDSTPPSLLSSSPADNATNVAVGTNIVLTFDEAVKTSLSTPVELHRSSDGAIVASFAITDASIVTISGNTVTINLPSDLVANTGYYLIIPAGVICDLGGAAFGGITVSTALNFTTGGALDSTPPTLTSSIPADNATGIAVDAKIVLTFSEAVMAGPGTVEIHRSSDNAIVWSGSTQDVYVTFSGNTVTISHPQVSLAAGTSYYVTITSGGILDLSGNPYAGISSSTALNFTTSSDVTAPTLTSSGPVDNATGVSISSNIVLTFSENVKAGIGSIQIVRSSDGSTFKTISITDSSQVSISGNTVTINPNVDLEVSTGYYIVIDAGAIQDLASNFYAGISNNSTLNFTTGSNDSTPPTLTSSSPADDAIGIAAGANIVLTFSESVKFGVGFVQVHRASDGGVVGLISVSDPSVVFSGNTVTISGLTGGLASGTAYYITIDSGAILDLAGNAYVGISSSTGLNFTTVVDATPPTLSGSTPIDNASGVVIGADIVLTFSEAVKSGTGFIQIHRSSDGSVAALISVTALAVSFSGSTVTISGLTTSLASGTSYYVTVDSGAILDLAGNAYAGISSSTALNFTTVTDATPPTLSGSTPADDASGVTVGANIVLTFSEAVKAGTGFVQIHRSSDGGVVALISVTDLSVSFSGNTVTVSGITGSLAAGTSYYLTVDAGAILDLAGNAYAGISSNTALNFTTAGGGADTTAPTLTVAVPADNATGVATGANIVLTFSEAVKAGTGFIVIHAGITSIKIAVTDTSQVTISGNTVTINPTANLTANTAYYITMTSGVIKDIAGNNYAGISSPTALNFTTGAASLTSIASADQTGAPSHAADIAALTPPADLMQSPNATSPNHATEAHHQTADHIGEQAPSLMHDLMTSHPHAFDRADLADRFEFSPQPLENGRAGLASLMPLGGAHPGEAEATTAALLPQNPVIDPIGEAGATAHPALPQVPHREIALPPNLRDHLANEHFDLDSFDFSPRASVPDALHLTALTAAIPTSALANHLPESAAPDLPSGPHLVVDPIGEVGVHTGHGPVVALPHGPHQVIDGLGDH